MYLLNCIDISESEAYNTVKSIFQTFFFSAKSITVTLLSPRAEFRSSSEAFCLLISFVIKCWTMLYYVHVDMLKISVLY